MKLKHPIFLLLTFLLGITAKSQTIEFVENKGQWDSRVLFAGKVPSGYFFIHRDGFTVLQNNEADMAALHEASHNFTVNNQSIPGNHQFRLRSHAYRVSFEGSNPAAVVRADKPLPTIVNYISGNDPSAWASACKVYQGITVHSLYDNIDIRYYSERGTLKYDLIVKPGGRVPDISMKYDGVDQLQVKNKELRIGTSVGLLRELSPYTYQYNEKGKVEVPVQFKVANNRVRFQAKEFNQKTELIIDPTLIFCSLSGSTVDNWGFTATYGPDGAFFGGGIVFGQGFPVSTGAFQTNFGGSTANGCFGGAGFDIGIIKLSADGSTRIWATYIGGSGDEMPQSLICTPSGELIIGGRTNSPVGGTGAYPTTAPKIGPGNSSLDWDIIVTRLSADGSRLAGSRRVGGTAEDGVNITACGGSATSLKQNYGDWSRSEVNIDGSGNVYLASSTKSADFPVVGGFQSTLGGAQDGVVLKFTSNLNSLLFSSYLGSTENDAAYVLAIHPSTGDVYVAGGTEGDIPGNKANTLSPGKPGGIDGYVAVVSSNGAVLRRLTYIGTNNIDQVFGIQFDRVGFPYVMGQTTGDMPAINAAWSETNGRQFIAKLQPDLSAYVYRTTVGKGGTSPDFSPVAFLVDRCENVYVSGWGGRIANGYNSAGVQGLSVTPDAIKSSPDINASTGLGQDFYFFVLEKNATRQLYGSYFGQNAPNASGDHVDGGTSRFDQNGVIYQAICANCGTTLPYPTTPGAWTTVKPGSVAQGCNLAMVKIEFNFAGVGSGVQSSIMGVPRDTAGCVPLTVDFRDTLLQAVKYFWDFGDGSPMATTSRADTSHTYNAVGQYRVMLIAEDSTTCNIRDTSYLTIKVGATEASVDFISRRIDDCTLNRYQFVNTSVAPPGFPFSGQSFEWDFGDQTPRVTAGTNSVVHTYAAPGTYRVTLRLSDTTYCNSPDSITYELRVAPFVKADFKAPSKGCGPFDLTFENTSQAGTQFLWDFGDGSTSTDVNPTHTFNVGNYVIRLTAIDSGTCNIIDTKTFNLEVVGKPTAAFSVSPQPPVVNTPMLFANESSPDAVRFKWLFGDGDSLVTTSRGVVDHEYNATGTYEACLVAINSTGCPDTTCRSLRTLVEAAVDVPNAFTPLSNDRNNVIFVRGFGITKMRFTIWTRQGQKVFETNDKRIGWNGRYQNQLLPMDVYAYTLDVEFFDGSKRTKTGDITLIR